MINRRGQVKRREKFKKRIFKILGNKCSECGFDDERTFQISSITNLGKKISKNNNGNKFLRCLFKMSPEELRNNFQLLCSNCNWIKKINLKDRGRPKKISKDPEINKKREYARKLMKGSSLKLRTNIFNIIGSSCKNCGIKDIRVLRIDHINSDGGIERRKYPGNKLYYHILSLNPDEAKKRYQTLCVNCNNIKKYVENELVRSKT